MPSFSAWVDLGRNMSVTNFSNIPFAFTVFPTSAFSFFFFHIFKQTEIV